MGVNGAGARLSRWLALPLTAGCDLDDSGTTALRRQIIASKPFLRRIYEDWYAAIATSLPPAPGPILELGSGPGFMRDRIANVVASDVLWVPDLNVAADATRLPFGDGVLRAIAMTNVFHHIPDARAFLAEAARCVRPGGAMVLIEPWVTRWSTFVYQRLHHEPFDPAAAEWTLPKTGPLSGANGALPWIVFDRDRSIFEREFPSWRVASVDPLMPFRYLVSGGVSLRSLSPGWSYPLWSRLEQALGAHADRLGMFARIVIMRTGISE